MIRLEIDRSKWVCGDNSILNRYPNGHGNGPTALLNKEGFMCCLGFRCLLSNITKDQIIDIGEPCEIALNMSKDYPRSLVDIEDDGRIYNSDFAKDAIEINDHPDLTRAEREQKLIELAKENGEEWVFIGEYTDALK